MPARSWSQSSSPAPRAQDTKESKCHPPESCRDLLRRRLRGCRRDRRHGCHRQARSAKADPAVKVQVFAPRPGDTAGKASKGFFVDLAVQYPSLASSGADFQLTGPTPTRTRPVSPAPLGRRRREAPA